MTLDPSSLRCGECGHKGIEIKDISGWYKTPYKYFPSVLVTKTYMMPVCPKCQNVLMGGGWGNNIDDIIEQSIRENTKELIINIQKKYNVNNRKLSNLVGITLEFLVELINKKVTISYTLYLLFKLIEKNESIFQDIYKI